MARDGKRREEVGGKGEGEEEAAGKRRGKPCCVESILHQQIL